jgi:hypothetical protein
MKSAPGELTAHSGQENIYQVEVEAKHEDHTSSEMKKTTH